MSNVTFMLFQNAVSMRFIKLGNVATNINRFFFVIKRNLECLYFEQYQF